MAGIINFSAKELLEKVFTKNVKGYDPVEVDATLDDVIDDYHYYEKFVKEAKPYIVYLENELRRLKTDVSEKEVQIVQLKKRLGSIKDNPKASRENIDLLKYIDALERALYEKGVNPKKLKY